MAARDDDPLRVNGQQLVNLAKEMLAGTLAGLTYPKEHLNDLRLAEGPTLAPIRVPSDQDHVEHAQKAAQFGKSVLSSWRVIYKSPPATKTASLTHYTINDVYNAYSTNATNPRAVAEKVLEAIEASNRIQPPLKAIVQCNAEDVRRQADASTQRWKEGKQLGPFDGVFVSIKVSRLNLAHWRLTAVWLTRLHDIGKYGRLGIQCSSRHLFPRPYPLNF